jgi:hypothetical protein
MATKKAKKVELELDYRIGHKVIATLTIEDKGQDFIELDVMDNGYKVTGNKKVVKADRFVK